MTNNIAIITDAWHPQTNGVVRTLGMVANELRAMSHTVTVIGPDGFGSVPCPTYPEIRLALFARRALAKRLDALAPDVIHIATEGPLGLAARRYCLARGLQFTTSFHTKFPEYVHARTKLPLAWTYRFLRWFHAPSRAMLVPTASLQQQLMQRGFANTVLWTRGVDTTLFTPTDDKSLLDHLPRPIYVCVGRVAVEKNLEDFLELPLEGTKLIVGDGPDLEKLKTAYPDAVFVGKKAGAELAAHYTAADVFVFPSKTDTFGLVLLEALASGLPVAAYPVTGPLDVITSSQVGALHDDLAKACQTALALKPQDCRDYALGYSWRACAQIVADNMVVNASAGQ